MKILHVVGARPNFMKAAPVISAIAGRGLASQLVVHTGQHYDANLSEVFFKQLNLPWPNVNLGAGSGSHSTQTANIMMRFEPVVLEHQPDLVLVYGDVNSTIAAALVCAKLSIQVGHVEAGLRSFDRTMPEEINRILTDQVADLLFTPSTDGDENLLREGIHPEKIHRVGNVMIDTLVRLLPEAAGYGDILCQKFGLDGQDYGLVTLHRPGNVDHPERLAAILNALERISKDLPLLFPMHPRTRQRLDSLARNTNFPSLQLLEPLGYLEFLGLMQRATLVITDSGGVQEETTFLGVPCLTLRENTERPVTVQFGTNRLIGEHPECLDEEVANILLAQRKYSQVPPLWDGKAAERIASIISKVYLN